MNEGTGAHARRAKVLVVDDNDVCRALVREALEGDGFDVVELGSPVGMSSVVSLVRTRMTTASLQWVNRGSGVIIVAFGIYALASAVAHKY